MPVAFCLFDMSGNGTIPPEPGDDGDVARGDRGAGAGSGDRAAGGVDETVDGRAAGSAGGDATGSGGGAFTAGGKAPNGTSRLGTRTSGGRVSPSNG